MKFKPFILVLITLISMFIVYRNYAIADLNQEFTRLVNSIKMQTVNKAAKIVNVKFASPNDQNFVQNSSYCRGTSSSTPTQTTAGLLTCLSGYLYTIKSSKYIYTYSYSASESKLKLVTVVSSANYPIGYYSYSYPDGKLKLVVVELSSDKKMLFEPNGKLKRFSSPTNCISESNGVFAKSAYAYQMCNNLFSQEETILKNSY